MAEEYGVRLKVTADTAEAKQKMDELLEQKSQRVQNATGMAGASGDQGAVSVSAARKAGRAAGQEFERTVGKGPTGQMIGKAIAGFVLHQGIGAAFSFATTPGGDNTNVERASSAASGAIQFGTVGAMLGGPVGAGIGAAAGAIQGLVSQLAKERQDSLNTRIEINRAARHTNSDMMSGFGAVAQMRLLDWQGSRDGRIEWLSNNRRDIQRRQGDAQKRLSSFKGDVNSEEYEYLSGEFKRLTGMYGQALSAEMQERMKPLYEPYDVSEFSDSFSKRGLGVGPTVDVAYANDRIIEQQKTMVDLLQKLVDRSNEGAGMNGEGLGEALREMYAWSRLN